MGPSIIFDKSALQSLSRPALHEVNRYFYTVLPDVLLHEILADLTTTRKKIDPEQQVATIAKKITFHDACASIHFRKLCVQDLLGNRIPMERRPVVDAATGQKITTDDGLAGFVRNVQPENVAVLRWGGGVFSREDFDFAAKWRANLPDFDVEASTELRQLRIGVSSIEDANMHVNAILQDPESHLPLLCTYMGFLGCGEKTRDRVLFRWKMELPTRQVLPAFAPYTTHCLRVYLLYYCAASHSLLPTKSNTIVDLEYFYHTPFAQVFCSSDRLHKRMAPFVLDADQTFLDGPELKSELDGLADQRQATPDALPQEGSLVHSIWMQHWNRPPSTNQPPSDEEIERLTREMAPILKAMQEQARRDPSTERFPKQS